MTSAACLRVELGASLRIWAELFCMGEKGLRRLFAGVGHYPKGRMIPEQRWIPQGYRGFLLLANKTEMLII